MVQGKFCFNTEMNMTGFSTLVGKRNIAVANLWHVTKKVSYLFLVFVFLDN